ncbi:MAG: DNA primase, partial [Cyanobacteria bacterium Co-bin13]|nr:DNA primase [Cyanobacteria bacterium Co-bin13]
AQVRRQRRAATGDPKRKVDLPPLPWKTSALEQAEAALLRLFLHAPDYRQAVAAALEDRDLQFSYSHHRALWRLMQQILTTPLQPIPALPEPEVEPAPVDLVVLLRNHMAEIDSSVSQLQHLLYLDEKEKRDILRAPLIIRAATACMEKIICEKRYRHFLSLWAETDCTESPDQHAHYQKQIYAEKRRIEELEKERQVTFEDLAQIPWVGEFYDSIDS